MSRPKTVGVVRSRIQQHTSAIGVKRTKPIYCDQWWAKVTVTPLLSYGTSYFL